MRLVAPEVATLTLAGYGEDEQALRKAASGLAHVHIGHSIKDLKAFLGECDAVVIPSRWEAFGLVAAEARSAGRPIIVSGLDGLSEQVSAKSGLSVAAEDPKALADAIVRLHGCDLEAMGRAARVSAQRHFEAHVQGWHELLESVDAAGHVSARAVPAAS